MRLPEATTRPRPTSANRVGGCGLDATSRTLPALRVGEAAPGLLLGSGVRPVDLVAVELEALLHSRPAGAAVPHRDEPDLPARLVVERDLNRRRCLEPTREAEAERLARRCVGEERRLVGDLHLNLARHDGRGAVRASTAARGRRSRGEDR